MTQKVCEAHIVSYPGGGAWAVQLMTKPKDRKERNEERCQSFLERLAAIPRSGEFRRAQATSFVFSMTRHREASREERIEFLAEVKRAFCDIFGYGELRFV